MKKSSLKRATTVQQERIYVKKPFGFCCDKKSQDLETRYDRRKAPFKSSMTDIVVGSGGPSFKFRFQDVGALPYPSLRTSSRIKSAAFLGDCKFCRQPLRWYLEDEIELARDMFARKRQTEYNTEMDRNVEVAKQKEKWRKIRRKKRKLKKNSQ